MRNEQREIALFCKDEWSNAILSNFRKHLPHHDIIHVSSLPNNIINERNRRRARTSSADKLGIENSTKVEVNVLA